MTWLALIYDLLTSLLKECSAKNKEIDTKAPYFGGSSGATSSRKLSISSPINQNGVTLFWFPKAPSAYLYQGTYHCLTTIDYLSESPTS